MSQFERRLYEVLGIGIPPCAPTGWTARTLWAAFWLRTRRVWAAVKGQA
jgi:hypothetical protein